MINKIEIFQKAAWIHIENKRVLVARSKGYEIFFLPGGNLEKDETNEDALIRELKEELSIDAKKESINYVVTFEAPSFEFPETIFIQMHCYVAEYFGNLNPSSEIEEFAWFDYDDSHKTSAVDQLVLHYLKEIGLIN